jgi:hypothetical protein
MDVTNLYDGTGGWVGGWPGGWVTIWKIMPLCGPILQAKSCQRFSAELRFQDWAECGKIEYPLVRTTIREHCMVGTKIRKHCMVGKKIRKHCMVRAKIIKHCMVRMQIMEYCMVITKIEIISQFRTVHKSGHFFSFWYSTTMKFNIIYFTVMLALDL